MSATHRTRQITECRNKEGFPYENKGSSVGSSVRTFIFPSLSYFIITLRKNIYDFKKIKYLISIYLCWPKICIEFYVLGSA